MIIINKHKSNVLAQRIFFINYYESFEGSSFKNKLNQLIFDFWYHMKNSDFTKHHFEISCMQQ